MTSTAPNERACYCRPGETTCGTCERCGAAGHTRHHPGPVPATGAWCDRCYRIVGIRYQVLRYALPLLLVAGVVLLSRTCAG